LELSINFIKIKNYNYLENIIIYNNELNKLKIEIKKEQENILILDNQIIKLNNNSISLNELKEKIKIKKDEVQKKLQNENLLNNLEMKNKHLLSHKFNNSCKECYDNKLIHNKIGYQEELENIKDNIIKLINSEKELEELELIYEKQVKLNKLLDDKKLQLKNIENI
jgi:hypothetical protein